MKAVRTQLLIGFLAVAMIVYFALLVRIAVALISDGNREALTEESERVRKSLRGEEVGRLG